MSKANMFRCRIELNGIYPVFSWPLAGCHPCNWTGDYVLVYCQCASDSVDMVMVGHTTSPRPRVAVLGGGIIGPCHMSWVELETILREVWCFTITEKAPTRAFSWFKTPTSALHLRQYAQVGNFNQEKALIGPWQRFVSGSTRHSNWIWIIWIIVCGLHRRSPDIQMCLSSELSSQSNFSNGDGSL